MFLVLYYSISLCCPQSYLDTMALFCPPSRLDDGVLWLIIISDRFDWRDKLVWFSSVETAGFLTIADKVKMIPIR